MDKPNPQNCESVDIRSMDFYRFLSFISSRIFLYTHWQCDHERDKAGNVNIVSACDTHGYEFLQPINGQSLKGNHPISILNVNPCR